MHWKSEKNLEDEVFNILKGRGFRIEREKWIPSRSVVGSTVADVVATKDDDTFVFEVKGRSILHPSDILAFVRLREDSVLPKATYIIVTPDEPNSDIKAIASQRGVSVIKKADLLEILKSKH